MSDPFSSLSAVVYVKVESCLHSYLLCMSTSLLDTKRVVNCGLTTRFDAMSSTEIFEVINTAKSNAAVNTAAVMGVIY